MTGAVIAEFNPFHNGHLYAISKMRETGCDNIIAIMSGDYVQRGECAVIPKFFRAKQAVLNGVDLVVELPVPWALSSAEGFCCGGAYIADALGCVDRLFFGSECGDIDRLKLIAGLKYNDDFKDKLKTALQSGKSYASAYNDCLADFLQLPDKQKAIEPNDILAAEYIDALNKLESSIEPFAIKRQGTSHDGDTAKSSYASASLIRQMIEQETVSTLSEYMPTSSFEVLKQCINNEAVFQKSSLDRISLLHLRTMTPQKLSEIAGVAEGLENRIIDAAKQSLSLEELFDRAKTKRYSHSRIRRICMAALIGITKNDITEPPAFIRILAQNEKGAQLLKSTKTKIPLIGSYSQVKNLSSFGQRLFSLQSRAAQLYAVTCKGILQDYSEEKYKIAKY